MPLLKPTFLFATCQVGAESALKHEIRRCWPDLRFAYSRPGFLTFRRPAGTSEPADLSQHSVFARASGSSIARISVENAQQAARDVWRLAADIDFQRLHVWSRDTARVGIHGFTPGMTEAALAVRELLLEARPPGLAIDLPSEPSACPGDWVLDCLLVSDDQWWLGHHRAGAIPSRYPGGFLPVETGGVPISRAYFKMKEAIMWSGLPVRAGEQCIEIGSAPGGASQALLEKGLNVVGIDPAAMDPAVLAYPHFRHIRKRGHEVQRREFTKARWLTADLNVAPSYTLDTAEGIVTHPSVHIRGLVLTLKLLQWKLAEQIPNYLDRVRSWGYDVVHARQLQFNRQEICLAALRSGRTLGRHSRHN